MVLKAAILIYTSLQLPQCVYVWGFWNDLCTILDV